MSDSEGQREGSGIIVLKNRVGQVKRGLYSGFKTSESGTASCPDASLLFSK